MKPPDSVPRSLHDIWYQGYEAGREVGSDAAYTCPDCFQRADLPPRDFCKRPHLHSNSDWQGFSQENLPEADDPESKSVLTVLRKLTNEIKGVLGMSVVDIRDTIGHTNVAVLQSLIAEAEKILGQRGW